jgi:hypothetical protein
MRYSVGKVLLTLLAAAFFAGAFLLWFFGRQPVAVPPNAEPLEPQVAKQEQPSPQTPRTNVEPVAPQAAVRPSPDDYRLGDVLICGNNNLPAPLHGLPAPRRLSGWARIDRLLKADDLPGLFKECDGVNCYFVRAQTKVRVIDTNAGKFENETVLEVRFLAGRLANQSAFITKEFLNRNVAVPKDAVPVDHIPEKERREMFSGYFSACNEAFEETARTFSPLGVKGIEATLFSKRFEYEVEALERHHRSHQKLIQKSPRSNSEFEAVVWNGLAQGWEYTLKDY